MKALVAKAYGPPENLSIEELPEPEPGPGQIQVRIRAAGLNPGENRLVSGEFGSRIPLTLPHVLGHDFAGTVTALGDGVRRFQPGDEIFGFAAPRGFPWAELICTPPSYTTGTMAEYAVFEADTPALTSRPDELSPERAAALATTGLTALPVVRKLDPKPGDTVLVIGATGGVGTVLVPMLAAANVRVLATAGPADEAAIRELGATDVIDYTSGDVAEEALRRHPGGVDAIANLALPADGLAGVAAAVRRGGQIVTITATTTEEIYGRGDLDVPTAMSTHIDDGDLDELARRAVAGELPVTIGRTYGLDDGPQAYVDLARRHTFGKLVVSVR